MLTATFPVAVTEPGRADAVLSSMVDGLTRSAAQKWMEEGRVILNGKPVKKNTPLKPGDTLLVSPPQPQDIDLIPQDIPLDIVYEDDDVVVVNKPVGMVVHPAPGHPDGTLVNALLYHCKESLSGINGERRPGIVHRIDRDTSGLLIVAKNDKAHLALAQQLQDHSLFRLYHAVVVGGFKEESGTVDAPLARHPVDRKPTPTSPVAWRPGAPTRFGCTWPPSVTPWWGTRCTAPRSHSPAWWASVSTPPASPSPTPPPGSA